MATVYFARWLLLPTFEIMHNGAVAVENGFIVSVGSRSHVRRRPDDRCVNLGDMLLLPGFINSHTHLEENVLRDLPKNPAETFAAWRSKRNTRLKQTQENIVENAIRLGARELLSHGITTVADFSLRAASAAVLPNEPIRSFLFHEVNPMDAQEEESVVDVLKCKLDSLSDYANTGIGPSTLFSVSPKTHEALAELRAEVNCLYALHIAESSEELQAFSEQKGDLFFHITRKKDWPFGTVSRGSMDYALTQNLIPYKSLCIHCNYASGADLERLAVLDAAVITCFQYSRELGHKNFPLDVALNRGVLLCAATGSISSERSMNLLDELFCAKKEYPHISSAEMLKWITQNPARALGAFHKIGNIDIGKHADIIGLRFQQEPGAHILDDVIMSEPDVRMVMIDGEEIMADY